MPQYLQTHITSFYETTHNTTKNGKNRSCRGYAVQEDVTDDCRVCYAAREYANGDIDQRLDGCLLRIMEVFLPDSENRSMCA